jgi:hypothetical protein
MSLISSSEITSLTGTFAQHFDLFSRNITIFKEPKKSFSNTSQQGMAGYGNKSIPNNITYTPVSGVYPAIVLDDLEQNESVFPETSQKIEEGVTVIKVKQDARDFILNGKTESVNVDGRTFNVKTNFSVQNYLGLQYYYFGLKNTN